VTPRPEKFAVAFGAFVECSARNDGDEDASTNEPRGSFDSSQDNAQELRDTKFTVDDNSHGFEAEYNASRYAANNPQGTVEEINVKMSSKNGG